MIKRQEKLSTLLTKSFEQYGINLSQEEAKDLVKEFQQGYDEQIWECVRIANTAFHHGQVQGVQSKIKEIRQTLGLDSA